MVFDNQRDTCDVFTLNNIDMRDGKGFFFSRMLSFNFEQIIYNVRYSKTLKFYCHIRIWESRNETKPLLNQLISFIAAYMYKSVLNSSKPN